MITGPDHLDRILTGIVTNAARPSGWTVVCCFQGMTATPDGAPTRATSGPLTASCS